jgi:hypothetical protein
MRLQLTTREFPEICNLDPLNVLEVGCGVGNTTYPLIDGINYRSFDD